MSRSGYIDDCDQWDLIRWRGAVASAIRGKRGQAFLAEMLAALDAMPVKRLVANELECEGEVCAIGAVGKVRNIDMKTVDPEDRERVAEVFGISPALAAEIVFMNDEWTCQETPESRYARMRRWIVSKMTPPKGKEAEGN